MAVQTKAQIKTYIDTNVDTNGVGGITGAEVNSALTDIIDSVAFPAAAATWLALQTHNLGIKSLDSIFQIAQTAVGSSSAVAWTANQLVQFRATGGVTGAIVFTAPIVGTGFMHVLRVKGQVHQSSLNLIDFTWHGFASAGAWTYPRVNHVGSHRPMVRGGYMPTTGLPCLIIGDVATVWSYPHLAIMEAMFSHVASEGQLSNWTCSIVTDLSAYTGVTANQTPLDEGVYHSDSFIAGTNYVAPTGSGAGLTALNATQLTSGAVPAARMPALTGDVTTSAGAVATTIAAAAVTLAKMANLAQSTIIGRAAAAGTGVPTALTPAQVKTLLAIAVADITGLAAIASSGSATDLSAGTVPAARMPALTGDVTTSAGAVATTIATAAVSLAKMADLAQSTIIGRAAAAGTGVPTALSAAQVKTLLAIAATDVSGLAAIATSGSATDLTTGTVANARIAGNYTGFTGLTSSGTIMLTGGFFFNNQVGNAVGAIFYIDTDLAKHKQFIFRTATVMTWQMYVDGSGQTGVGDAGADYKWARYSDAGTLLGIPLILDRATGLATFEGIAGPGSGITALNATNLASGAVPAARMPALTGDVTTSAGAVATTIAAAAVTLAKMANLAQSTIIGRAAAAGTGVPTALSAAQVKTLLAIANTDVSGLGTMSTQDASAVAITGGTWIGSGMAAGSLNLRGGVTTADFVPLYIGHTAIGVNSAALIDFGTSGNPTTRSVQVGGISRAGGTDIDLIFRTSNGAPPVQRGYFHLGLVVSSSAYSSGDDKGTGTINAVTALYEAGVALSTKYLTPAGSGASLTALNATQLTSGAVPAARMPALTGDVTTSAGAVATTIATAAVTLAKMANLAQSTIIGRAAAAGTGVPTALTATQVKTLLAIANTDVSGLGTASVENTGTTGHNLLFGDGTNVWTALNEFSYGTFTCSSGTQDFHFINDDANGRMWFDVGGTGHASDYFLFGDAASPDNAMCSFGSMSLGAVGATPAAKLQVVQASNVTPLASFEGSAATASASILLFDRYRGTTSTAGVLNDLLSQFRMGGRNSAGASIIYADWYGQAVGVTAGSENGRWTLRTMTAGSLTTVFYAQAGIVVGAPTGGDKGVGTVNAVGVYDDNVLLTCLPLQDEFLRLGEVHLSKWDAISPVGRHPVAHKFADLLATGFDPRDPRAYVAKMIADQALPGMPTLGDWQQGGLSTGEMVNRLWLALEMLAVAWMSDRQERKAA